MKKLFTLIGCISLLLLSGCGSSVNYERDTSPGEVIEISYEQYLEKIENKETFMLLISQTNCSYCKEYKETTLKTYIPEHGVKIYELNLTNEPDALNIFDSFREEYVKHNDDKSKEDFGTPATFLIEKGKLKESFAGVLEEEQLDNYVTDYELDKKEDK